MCPPMRVTTTIALVTLSGCVVDVDGPAPQTGSDAGSNDTFVGLVASPANGAVVPGDPATLSIHVAGLYRDTSSRLAIQVLANPDDLASWETIATTTATGAASPYAYAVEVQPAARDPLRWPAGGVLRLRVVDSAGVALPVAEDG